MIAIDFIEMSVLSREEDTEDGFEATLDRFIEITVEKRIGDRRYHADQETHWKILG